jgi:hypothetical protein
MNARLAPQPANKTPLKLFNDGNSLQFGCERVLVAPNNGNAPDQSGQR